MVFCIFLLLLLILYLSSYLFIFCIVVFFVFARLLSLYLCLPESTFSFIHKILASVVQKMDNVIHQINRYPADKH